ncbi:MAG: hypothetical protein V7785_20790 [Bermanella sp.]
MKMPSKKILSIAPVMLASSLAFSAEQDVESRLQALEKVNISGSFRSNFTVKDYDDGQKDRSGDANFNVFTLGVDTESNGLRFSGQYRWYNYMDTLHHMYVAASLDEDSEVQVGVMKVPFGILPYESNNYWFGIPYYLGFNDDYDSGIKYLTQSGNLDIQVGFYMSSEFAASNANRYSIDVLNSSGSGTSTSKVETNEETNQFNLRLAYQLDNGELGLSTQYGQLYNSTTEKDGNQWAVALHHTAKFGAIQTQLEYIRYEFNPENPDGVDDDTIVVGAFADKYEVAAKGDIAVINLSYDVPVAMGSVSNLRFYNDYSHLVKDNSDFKDSQINTLGVAVTAGSLYVNVDFIMAKNGIYGGGGSDSYSQGLTSTDWNTRFNVNAGYYF